MIRMLYGYIESFEIWCWRRMEGTWIDHVKNGEELLRLKEKKNIEHIKKNKGRLFGLVITCVGTAYYNRLRKERYKVG